MCERDEEPSGENIIPLSWYQDCTDRFCHCGFCDSASVKHLPITFPARLIWCRDCLQRGYMNFL